MFQAPNVFQRATLPPATRESEPRPQAAVATDDSPAPAPGRPGQDAAAKRRDAYFDNAKYLAIVLVAVAHSWVPVMEGSRTAVPSTW